MTAHSTTRPRRPRGGLVRPALLALTVGMPAAALPAQAQTDWPVTGYDAGASRFSPLTQITPANVNRLKLAWRYDMRPAGVVKPDKAQLRAQAQARWNAQQGVRPLDPAATPPSPVSQPAARAAVESSAPAAPGGPPAPSSASQMTPIVVGDTMYFGSPFGRVVALDATTGREKWVLPLSRNEQTAPRGIAYWPGDRANKGRLVVTLRSNKVLTVDPATGKVNSGFGTDGVMDLRTPEVMGSFPRGNLTANAMPVLYRNLMILGSRGGENPPGGPRGDVRAFDIVSGKLVWTFNAIPEPGEVNFGTWGGDSWKDRGGVNVWNSPTVDAERGIVYLTFGTPAYDRDGTTRPGDGLYGTSIVAVKADTGKYLWHFQATHHDIWDLDMPGNPTLMEVRRGGRTIPAVAAINKQSLLFILDRVTGKPLFEVREVPVPPSDVPGERASPTQPIPVRPEPLARQSIDLATDISDVTPEHEAWCRDWVKSLNMQSTVQYQPLGWNRVTVQFPGSGGGMNWWGGAFDRKNGLYIANVLNQGSVQMLRQGRDGKVELAVSANSWFADVRNGGMQCQKGPWGELVAVNVATGDVAWRRTLGVTDWLPAGRRDTGRPNAGGPMITAGGLVFIAATDDRRFRAFEAKTGKLLWETMLDAAGHTAPITYLGRDRRQYIALIATGGSYIGSPPTNDDLVVYALP